MSNYYTDLENNKDYFGGEMKYRTLFEIKGLPTKAYDILEQPLLVHMRMMYGRMDWEHYVIKLDEITLCLLREESRKRGSLAVVVNQLQPGMNVIIVNTNDMSPITYQAFLHQKGEIEVLTLDNALDHAVYWYVENILYDYEQFKFCTMYFLAAFRLALMEGDMTDEERFSEKRLDQVWRDMYASLIWHVSQKLADCSKSLTKESWISFDLDEYDIADYKKALLTNKDEK